MQKKSKFELIDDQHLKNIKQIQSSKKPKHVSTISIFENGMHASTRSAKNQTLTSSSIVSLNKLADQVARHQSSMNNSSRSILMKAGNSSSHLNSAHNLNTNSTLSSLNKNMQKRPPLPQMPPVFQLQNNHLQNSKHANSAGNTEESLSQRFSSNELESPEAFNTLNQSTQCFIYGISNKAFSGDDLNPADQQSSLRSKTNENFVPSSFRPMTNNSSTHGSLSNVNKIEIKSEHVNNRPISIVEISSVKSLNVSPKDETVTYHHPWKICTNDYEALEATNTHTNTGTSGKLFDLNCNIMLITGE